MRRHSRTMRPPNRDRRIAFAAFVTILVSMVTVLASPHSVAADACGSLTRTVYQAVNPSTQRSLLTPWKSEASSGKSYGFTDGPDALLKASTTAGAGLVPVYRLYHPNAYDFAWSAEPQDTAILTGRGYQNQKIEFYALPSPASCTVPVHRLVHQGVHRTAMADDVAKLTASGWTDEGASFHAISLRNSPTPSPSVPQLSSADSDGKFSLAVYPDTQNELMVSTDTRLSNRNSYIIDQRDTRDIRYVLHVGDLVNWDTATDTNPNDHRQYDWASREMRNLEAARIPWAAAIGNHDSYAVGPTGGSARPGVVTSAALRDTRTFNQYFSVARFGNIKGTFEPNKVDNAYRVFNAVGKQWLILNLELWPRAEAVAWARQVVTGHPDHNVIVLTHSYVTSSGGIDQTNGGYGSMSGKYLFDNLIKLYPNIKLVFSGHVNTSAIRTDRGVQGNKVVSVLTSFHDNATNQVRLVELDSKAGTFRTEIFAPKTGATYPSYDTLVNELSFVG